MTEKMIHKSVDKFLWSFEADDECESLQNGALERGFKYDLLNAKEIAKRLLEPNGNGKVVFARFYELDSNGNVLENDKMDAWFSIALKSHYYDPGKYIVIVSSGGARTAINIEGKILETTTFDGEVIDIVEYLFKEYEFGSKPVAVRLYPAETKNET